MRSRRAWELTGLAAVAAVTAVIGLLAWNHARTAPPGPLASVASTPAIGPAGPSAAPTATPSPTPTAAAIVAPGAAERFLSIASGVIWRAVAGSCSGAAPSVARSDDGGVSWTDVTAPLRAKGVRQIASLDALVNGPTELVAGTGASCAAQSLHTYTSGRFWAPAPGELALSRYILLGDPSRVVLRTGRTPAPCPDAWGMRASGSVVATVCAARAYLLTGSSWMPLAADDVSAVAIAGGDMLVAHRAADCSGVAVDRFHGAVPARVGCVQGADPTAPIAIATSGARVVVWAGSALTVLG